MAKIKEATPEIWGEREHDEYDVPSGYQYTDERGEHLHTLNGKPLFGTSTITKVIAKPLTWWAAGKALEAFGWVNPRKTGPQTVLASARRGMERLAEILNGTVEGYIDFLNDCYRAHDTTKNQAASDGTDMHAELEAYVKRCIENGGAPHEITFLGAHKAVAAFAAWAIGNVQRFIWSEAHCYSEPMWVGGITDCGAILKDGKRAVIDFKSSKEAYFDQFAQAAGYAQLIEENGLFTANGVRTHAPMKIDALIIFPFGGGEPKIIHAVEDYQRAFLAALTLHKLQQSFDQMAS
jgi:hypothetical protein